MSAEPSTLGDRSAARRTGKRPLSYRERRERRAGLLFLAPDAIGLTVFLAIPMVLALALGFFEVTGFGGYNFVGLENYQRMLDDPQFTRSVGITLIFLVTLVPAVFIIALALALLVQQKIPFVGAIRSALFVPYVVSLVVVAMMWQFMLADNVGFVNQLLDVFGVTGISWLGDPSLALLTVILITIWFQMGYYMIIFLAGLQDIPSEYYEAARIDGAGAWQRFRHVTWPLLKPTSFFVLLTLTIALVTGGFDLVYILTAGGPAGATSILIFYIYEQAFVFGEFGYAAAMGSVLVVILLAWSGLLFALTRGGRFEYGD